MDVLRFRSHYPTLLHPIDYYNFKKHFQPKLAPPRKKPAYSSLQFSPAKFHEEFGLTINPPSLKLGGGNNFTFVDGVWIKTPLKNKVRSCALRKQEKHRISLRPKSTRLSSVEEVPVARRSTKPVEALLSCRRPTVQPDRECDLARCRRELKERFENDKQTLEDYYRQKLKDCDKTHREIEERMRREHENKINAQQSQVDALLIKCNELKGENNLLHIKVSKMMDMLAECAAEVNLQEAELAQVAQTLQTKKTGIISGKCYSDDDHDDYDEEGDD